MTTASRPALIAVGLAALLIGGALAWRFKPDTSVGPPSLATIENMGQLVSVRVHVADVVNYTLPRAVGIPATDYEIRYGGTTVLLVARGDCSLASDLRRAKYESVDATSRRVTVSLSSPSVLSPRVNHAPADQGGSVLYAIQNNALEAVIPGDENRRAAIDKAYGKAQAIIAAACRADDVQRQARTNTEAILKELYKATGWAVTFKWRGE